MGEEWRDIPGWPGYQASRSGLVRSAAHELPDGGWHGGKVLKQRPDRKGYWTVTLRRADGTRVPVRVHVGVALAWHGERPPGQHVLHPGDDKDRNGADDLKYGTPRRNVLERTRREKKNRRRKEKKAITDRALPPATPVTEAPASGDAV